MSLLLLLRNNGQAVAPTGIASAEALGTPALTGTNTFAPVGIASGEALGSAAVQTQNALAPTGMASAAAFGTGSVRTTDALAPGGIASGEAFGPAAMLTHGALSVAGIASGPAAGAPALTQITYVAPTGIDAAEVVPAVVLWNRVPLPGSSVGSGGTFLLLGGTGASEDDPDTRTVAEHGATESGPATVDQSTDF